MKPIVVIKFGGSLLSDPTARRAFLKQAAGMSRRAQLVLVHGGGPDINAALEKMGIKSQWVKGRRVTDEAAMTVVEGVLSGQVNKALAGELCTLGVLALGLSGRDGNLLRARLVPELGRVGEPDKINPTVLLTLFRVGFTPVLSSVGFGKDHKPVNINADEAASALAIALKANRLIFMTDVAGVLDQNKKTIPLIRIREVKRLIDDGVITGGMIPKILSCAAALKKGVKEIAILDGRSGLSHPQGTRLLP